MRLVLATKYRRLIILAGKEAAELLDDDEDDGPTVVNNAQGDFGFAPVRELEWEEDE